MGGSLTITKDCENANYCLEGEQTNDGVIMKTNCCVDDLCNTAISVQKMTFNIFLFSLHALIFLIFFI